MRDDQRLQSTPVTVVWILDLMNSPREEPLTIGSSSLESSSLESSSLETSTFISQLTTGMIVLELSVPSHPGIDSILTQRTGWQISAGSFVPGTQDLHHPGWNKL